MGLSEHPARDGVPLTVSFDHKSNTAGKPPGGLPSCQYQVLCERKRELSRRPPASSMTAEAGGPPCEAGAGGPGLRAAAPAVVGSLDLASSLGVWVREGPDQCLPCPRTERAQKGLAVPLGEGVRQTTGLPLCVLIHRGSLTGHQGSAPSGCNSAGSAEGSSLRRRGVKCGGKPTPQSKASPDHLVSPCLSRWHSSWPTSPPGVPQAPWAESWGPHPSSALVSCLR